nr:pyridoxal phosphate-dependent aminotransferase [Rhizobium leguminosarum]
MGRHGRSLLVCRKNSRPQHPGDRSRNERADPCRCPAHWDAPAGDPRYRLRIACQSGNDLRSGETFRLGDKAVAADPGAVAPPAADDLLPPQFTPGSSGNYAAGVLDLTLAGPDAALLPRLAEAMAYGASVDDLNSYERSRIVPELKDAVSERWPYEAEAFLATNGGYNAVYTILHALVSSGSSVAIEHPTAMRLLDILEDLGVKIIPVACDGEGPLPDSLREALQQRPAAFLFQPRLHSVTGVTVSSSRLDQLGDVLEDSDTLIIEDDGVGDVSAAPPQSLGGRFAERTIHILSLSKSLGPDLRLAVLSSSAPIVDQIQSYRSFSAGWTSRILQGAAAWLLRDPASWQLIGEAREIYQQRRDALADALSERGIPIPPGQGLCLWVPVVSEPFAMVTLAARNIAVNPGSKFSVLPSSHIRVATSTLSHRCEEAADAIALAHTP